MAKLVPASGTHRKQPRKLGQLADQAKRVDWSQWWRDWTAADKEIEAEFEAAAARPFPTPRATRPKR